MTNKKSAPWPARSSDVQDNGNALQSQYNLDPSQAARFLQTLDPAAKSWTFQTFDDNKERGSKQLAHVFHGSFDQHAATLEQLNRQGAGIFVTVNETDGKGRKRENIQRVRAVFADFDGTPLPNKLPRQPHLVVQSSPGRWHVYWRIDGLPLDQFAPVQTALANGLGSDPSVCDLSRVMRLPGFLHQKGEPCLVQLHTTGAVPVPYPSEWFLLPTTAAATHSAFSQGRLLPPETVTDLRSALNALHADDYEQWIAVGQALHELGDQGRGLWVDWSQTSEKWRAQDARKWDSFDGSRTGYEAVFARAQAAGWVNPRSKAAAQVQPHGAPEPLRRTVLPAEPYPINSLGQTLGGAARSIQRVVQAPTAICSSSVLAAASLAAQHIANAEIDGRVYPLSLLMITIAESGERKSAVDKEALRAAKVYEKELIREYDAELKKRKEARKSSGGGNSSNSEISGDEISCDGDADEPQLPFVLAADVTYEGVFKLLHKGQPSLGLFADEGAQFFGGHGMTRENQMRTAAGVSKLWDSGELSRVRSGDGSAKLYGKRTAMHFMMQPVIAESVLSNPVLVGQGILARGLLAYPDGTAGSRRYVAESLRNDPAMTTYDDRLLELHRRPQVCTEDGQYELDPYSLHLTSDAKALWVNFYNWVEEHMKSGGEFASVKAWASKTPEQALRIAGVLTLVENPDARVIDKDAIGRAAELASWYLSEARRLSGTAELSPEVRDAEALLNWCHETGRQELYSAVALQYGPSRIRESKIFKSAINELARAGWAEPLGAKVVDGASRRQVWKILPTKEGI